ncbi:LOW QUALITY PROTEIN: hypothetical protein KUTeg_011891 [Tegillarca granosa]|uniref:Uncharacterized protein n=1 Tax=Tegillarca granosa TaxID=220873 RepID=A0ABQ9EXY6_TEGGR|nr:LOW QUALITY PROTEIN: hypothetical protein KUTeg_011891 [Tegillarca granosa]
MKFKIKIYITKYQKCKKNKVLIKKFSEKYKIKSASFMYNLIIYNTCTVYIITQNIHFQINNKRKLKYISSRNNQFSFSTLTFQLQRIYFNRVCHFHCFFLFYYCILFQLKMKSKVLIAGHSQAKYFSHHLKRTDVDVVSFSGFRIEQMWEKIHTMVPFYTMIVLHIGANNLWNDSVSKVLRQYQNLVQNIWTVNATCRVVISAKLTSKSKMVKDKNIEKNFMEKK